MVTTLDQLGKTAVFVAYQSTCTSPEHASVCSVSVHSAHSAKANRNIRVWRDPAGTLCSRLLFWPDSCPRSRDERCALTKHLFLAEGTHPAMCNHFATMSGVCVPAPASMWPVPRREDHHARMLSALTILFLAACSAALCGGVLAQQSSRGLFHASYNDDASDAASRGNSHRPKLRR